ncbi:MAG: hypothetical protein GEU78_15015 [Actinobacteria bacterium]|nr:hypothetical protein [Actinomycetota bacterium]
MNPLVYLVVNRDGGNEVMGAWTSPTLAQDHAARESAAHANHVAQCIEVGRPYLSASYRVTTVELDREHPSWV